MMTYQKDPDLDDGTGPSVGRDRAVKDKAVQDLKDKAVSQVHKTGAAAKK